MGELGDVSFGKLWLGDASLKCDIAIGRGESKIPWISNLIEKLSDKKCVKMSEMSWVS